MLGFYLSMLETEQERKRMSEVYEAYQTTCLFAAKSVLDDDWLAEDAVHNAWLNVAKKKELLFLPDDELRPLLITIVKRRAIDLGRRQARSIAESLDDTDRIPSSDEPLEVQISTAEDFERLEECVKTLSEPHRNILQMKYYSELSNTEIGQYLGVTNREVVIRLYKAKGKLRDSYFDEDVKYNA